VSVPIHILPCAWGRFELFSYFIDAPETAIVDTGIASSPADCIAPALRALGRRVEDVRWILLTHGHIDHIGGAHALWELTGGRAQVVIHEADAPMLRSRAAHVRDYLDARGRYLNDPDGEAKQLAVTAAAISGEMEPALVLRGGETLSLGGDVTVSVHSIPGHSAGAVAYVVDGQDDVFVGDSVEMQGAANGFPSYGDPDAYRSSLIHVRDEIRPDRMFLGHPYRHADGHTDGVDLDRDQARAALEESIEIESRIREVAQQCLADGLVETPSPYSPFQTVAEELGYAGDPTLEPSPFFTTMHGYRSLRER
jgi:glyoxylase-like metal-dependent hydrolase (beta-lactamase superfamily II)